MSIFNLKSLGMRWLGSSSSGPNIEGTEPTGADPTSVPTVDAPNLDTGETTFAAPVIELDPATEETVAPILDETRTPPELAGAIVNLTETLAEPVLGLLQPSGEALTRSPEFVMLIRIADYTHHTDDVVTQLIRQLDIGRDCLHDLVIAIDSAEQMEGPEGLRTITVALDRFEQNLISNELTELFQNDCQSQILLHNDLLDRVRKVGTKFQRLNMIRGIGDFVLFVSALNLVTTVVAWVSSPFVTAMATAAIIVQCPRLQASYNAFKDGIQRELTFMDSQARTISKLTQLQDSMMKKVSDIRARMQSFCLEAGTKCQGGVVPNQTQLNLLREKVTNLVLGMNNLSVMLHEMQSSVTAHQESLARLF